MNKRLISGTSVLVAIPVLAGCSMFGKVVDFDKLKTEITNELDSKYSELNVKVDSVSCDESNDKPEPGSTFTCEAKVKDVTVPVKVTVKDKDMNVRIETMSSLYKLDAVGLAIKESVSSKLSQQVTVDCGTGLKVVAPGGTFPCVVTNAQGSTGKLTFKVGTTEEGDSWEM